MKIAVVGSGISGLSAAYYLSKKHHVDLFEKEDRFGGHSHTIDLSFGTKKVSVDIGFIVFNYATYPNLINFFEENNIAIEKSDMSFSVSVEKSSFEYCGRGLNGIFSNKTNLFNLRFIKMFFDIIKFYKKCDNIKKIDQETTLGDYLNKENLYKRVYQLSFDTDGLSHMVNATKCCQSNAVKIFLKVFPKSWFI